MKDGILTVLGGALDAAGSGESAELIFEDVAARAVCLDGEVGLTLDSAPTDLDLVLLGDEGEFNADSMSMCAGGWGTKSRVSWYCRSLSSRRSRWLRLWRSERLGGCSSPMCSSLGEKTTLRRGDGDRDRVVDVLELDLDRGSSWGNRSADFGVVGMGDWMGGSGSGEWATFGELWWLLLGGGSTGMLAKERSGVCGESGTTMSVLWVLIISAGGWSGASNVLADGGGPKGVFQGR